MSRSRIITIVVAVIIIAIMFAIVYISKYNGDDNSNNINVTSTAPANYIPIIPKKEPPKQIIKKKEPPKQIIKKVVKIVYKTRGPTIEELRERENLKRAKQSAVFKDIKIRTTKEVNTTNHIVAKDDDTIKYNKDFKLKKSLALNPVKLDLVLTADKFIPIILKTAVSSELPGEIIGMVEDDIYSATGNNLLIPKGTTAFGEYVSLSKGGEGRLPIIWKRLLTPDGININFISSAVDIIGRSGALGEVDKRLFEKYGLALTLSTISSTLSFLAYKSINQDGTAIAQLNNNLVNNYKNDIANITNQIIKDNIKIAPIIYLKIGQRLLIKPKFDIWFNNIYKNNIKILINQNKKEN